MDHDKYIRTIQELEAVGSKWWPEEVKREAEEMSILQYLLDTQSKFISLLNLADRTDIAQNLFAYRSVKVRMASVSEASHDFV